MREYLLLMKELLRIKVSDTEHFSKEEKNDMLRKKVDFIFDFRIPVNYYACWKDRPTSYNLSSLPCHLSDDKWLANFLYLDKILRKNLSYYEVLSYVRYSEYFYDKRNSFVIKIVRNLIWQIEEAQGFTIEDDYSTILNSENADKDYRNYIDKILRRIGFSRELSNLGIEANQDIWKEKYMKIAFDNRFNPGDLISEGIPDASTEFFDIWIKCRNYEYYKKYRYFMKLLGLVNEEVLINNHDLNSLRILLNQYERERYEEMKIYRKDVKRLGLMK